jgi:ribosomal protein S18 acetylase RimI-like enzyme
MEPGIVGLVCTTESFSPADHASVRWLDRHADYPLVREAWERRGGPPSREEWLSWWDEGYEFCAVVEGDRIQAVAAAWRCSDDAWELAGVWTRDEARRRGHGRAVCSLATAHILAHVRAATCSTRSTNRPMLELARSLGYRPA